MGDKFVPFFCNDTVLDGRQCFMYGNWIIVAFKPTFMKYKSLQVLQCSSPDIKKPFDHSEQTNLEETGIKDRSTVQAEPIQCPLHDCKKCFTTDWFLLDHWQRKHTVQNGLKKRDSEVKTSVTQRLVEKDDEDSEKKRDSYMETSVTQIFVEEDKKEPEKKLDTDWQGKTKDEVQYGGGPADDEQHKYECNLSKRVNVLDIYLPVVKLSSKVIVLSNVNGLRLTDASTSMFMPPTTQLERINQHFSQNENIISVELDYGIFSKQAIAYFYKIHDYKILLQKVLNEENWFSSLPHNVLCETPLSQTNINAFKSILFNHSDSNVISLNNRDIEIKDLSDICCDRWINNILISHIIHLLNKELSKTKCFVYMLKKDDDLRSLLDSMKTSLLHNIVGAKIAFCAHVGNVNGYSFLDSCVIDGNTYTANHFAVCVYSFDSNEVLYCDPLGWNIPEQLNEKITEFLHCLQLQNFTFFYCHDPYSFVQTDTVLNHICSSQCSTYYFVQKCSSVCGVAAIITLALLTFEWNTFLELIKSGQNVDPCRISYLRNISTFSKFLRLVIIDWLISGSIDITKIFKLEHHETSQTTNMPILASLQLKMPNSTNSHPKIVQNSRHDTKNEDKKMESNEPHVNYTKEIKAKNCSPESLTSKWQLDFSLFKEYVQGTPELSYIKTTKYVRLRFKLKNGREISKSFKCSNGVESVKEKVRTFVNSTECLSLIKGKFETSETKQSENCSTIDDLLARPLQMTFIRNKIRVRFFLKNGTTREKYFPCSSLGMSDESAINSIHLYLRSKDCFNWLKSEWVKIGTIPTGPQMKQYISSFNFDVTKHFVIHKNVERIYDPETLSISVTENKTWGKTHRTDETYTTAVTDSDFTAVTLYINCASKSNQCRGDCGILNSDKNSNSDSCPKCGQCLLSGGYVCSNCQSTVSPQWCQDNFGNVICKTCYEYKRRNKKFKIDTTKRSENLHVYHSHFVCKWKMKLVLESKDLSNWGIFQATENHFYHSDEPNQEKRRPTLQTRDTWDMLRISTKATPQQIFSSENRARPIKLNFENKSFHSLKEIKTRCRTVDQHYLKSGMKYTDEVPINSDWRNCEKILEGNFKDVLLFQRGDSKLNRCYHIVLCRDENTYNLRQFGQHVLGYDIKQDFMSARFKTACITYSDTVGSGRAGAIAICNCEDANSHALTLQMVLANIPCGNSDCLHEKQLYIFNDNSGFFSFRPCALSFPLQPIIQHDKALDIRNAVLHQNFMSTLCNFHALKAFRTFIRDNSELELFIRPLETGFKCIMRSWNRSMTENLILRYKVFISNIIPEHLMSNQTRNTFLSYLQKHWFSHPWIEVFTAEVFQLVPVLERRDPLLLTDNITERKFKEFDENDFGSHLNRSIAILVMKFLNDILYRESVQTEKNLAKKRPCPDRQKEETLATSGLNLLQKNHVITHDGWETTGWALVKSDTTEDKKLSDDFFTLGLDGGEDVEILKPVSTTVHELQQMSNSLVSEHGYSVISKCKRIVSDLNKLALNMFFEENLCYLPEELSPSLGSNTNICNIKLCTCTCFHFIVRGQPYFCKHLYACLAGIKNVRNADALVDIYLETFPEFPSSLTPYLNQTPLRNTTLDKIMHLKNISHLASAEETNEALQGKILSILHNSNDSGTTFAGRPAERRPHNAGFRSKNGPSVCPNYALVNDNGDFKNDPYRPNVKFPENCKERHGGRKLQKASKRGVSFNSIMQSALKQLGIKLKVNAKVIHNKSTHSFSENVQNDEICASRNQQNDSVDIESYSSSTSAMPAKVNQERKTPSLRTKDNYIMCAKCVKDDICPPFCCASKPELDRHMSLKHKEENFVCAFCYMQYNALLYFSTDRLLREHQKDHKVPKLTSKLNELDTASDALLSEISNCKQPGIANLAQMKLNQRVIHSKTASDLLKEKNIEELSKH